MGSKDRYNSFPLGEREGDLEGSQENEDCVRGSEWPRARHGDPLIVDSSRLTLGGRDTLHMSADDESGWGALVLVVCAGRLPPLALLIGLLQNRAPSLLLFFDSHRVARKVSSLPADESDSGTAAVGRSGGGGVQRGFEGGQGVHGVS